MNYFIIINGRQSGPHSLNELRSMQITRQTPVWTDGMPDWADAGDVPELAVLFAPRPPKAPLYYAIVNGVQIGPMLPYELIRRGVAPQTPVWSEGMSDWREASTVDDFRQFFTTPAIQHTNWLPWAIVGTVLALCTSCIGVIFGIIGIIKASEANRHYAEGNESMGRMANSNAQIMTIIALALDAVGIMVSGYMLSTGVGMTSFVF